MPRRWQFQPPSWLFLALPAISGLFFVLRSTSLLLISPSSCQLQTLTWLTSILCWSIDLLLVCFTPFLPMSNPPLPDLKPPLANFTPFWSISPTSGPDHPFLPSVSSLPLLVSVSLAIPLTRSLSQPPPRPNLNPLLVSFTPSCPISPPSGQFHSLLPGFKPSLLLSSMPVLATSPCSGQSHVPLASPRPPVLALVSPASLSPHPPILLWVEWGSRRGII